MPSRELPGLIAALDACTTPADIAATAERYAAAAPGGELAAHRDWIDSCYGADTVEEIVERLADRGVPAAKEAAATILSKSLTSLKVTLEAVRRARRLDSLEAVLDQEYRVSSTAFTRPDLVEGVRAQIIDKDRNPRWRPAGLAEVTEADVARFFAPLGDGELGLGPGAPTTR